MYILIHRRLLHRCLAELTIVNSRSSTVVDSFEVMENNQYVAGAMISILERAQQSKKD